jgi:photosystem II stability/assembly factor-like uncharacterized protein
LSIMNRFNTSLKFLIFILSMFNFRLAAQSDIKTIINQSGNFAEINAQAEKFFLEKYKGKGLRLSDLSSGENRDGQYVKYMRWKSFWQNHLDANGYMADIPAFMTATAASNAAKPNLGPFQNRTWSNISNSQFITTQIGLGRTTCIAFHPTDANTFFVGTPMGGIWKTTNGGSTYTSIADNLPFLAVSSIIIDPNNPQIMYIAISDHVWYGSQGLGVYKTTDGGATWQPTALQFSFSDNIRIYRLEQDPDNPNTILVATQSGIYRTSDGFATVSKTNSISTFDIHFKKGNNLIVFAGTTNGKYLRSTDGGLTFTEVADFGDNFVEITLSANTDKILLHHNNQIRISTDGGLTFAATYISPHNDSVYGFNPANDNEIVGGFFDVYKSTNGGSSFTQITHWLGSGGVPLIHVDQRNIFINPHNTDEAFFCNDGGVFKYRFSTDTWGDLSNGLQITQYYDIAVSQTNTNIVSGGSQDNSSMYRNSAGVWQALTTTGDGMITEIDPTNENIIYWEFQNGGLRRTQNGTTTNITPLGKSGAWETPYKLDPTNPSRIVAGYDIVYSSINKGSSWTAISGAIFGGNVEQLAIAKSNPERIYVSKGTTMYIKDTTDNNWVTRNPPITNAIRDIEVDPNDMNTVYIVTSGYSSGKKVFKSTDAGATWTNISGSLPNVSVTAIELYETVSGGMFIGTNMGVYYRDDTLDDWYLYGKTPNTEVRDIEIQYSNNLIRVGTHGRGVLEAPIDLTTCISGSPDTDGDGKCNIVDICPLIPNNQLGQPCDDGDALTIGEFYDSKSCKCAGGVPTITYCAAAGTSGTGSDYIANVKLGSIDNASGQTQYSDFRTIYAELNANKTFTLTVRLNYSFAPDVIDAWIDYNRNGVFDNTTERIAMSALSNHISSGTFTVPNLSIFGTTTMRVRARYNGSVNPCGSMAGEVEDYAIILQPENPCPQNMVITGVQYFSGENYNHLTSNKIDIDTTKVNQGSILVLDANKSVLLNNGFEVKNGAVFTAKTGGCN